MMDDTRYTRNYEGPYPTPTQREVLQADINRIHRAINEFQLALKGREEVLQRKQKELAALCALPEEPTGDDAAQPITVTWTVYPGSMTEWTYVAFKQPDVGRWFIAGNNSKQSAANWELLLAYVEQTGGDISKLWISTEWTELTP